MSKFKVLLVDDEPDILEFLSYNLIKEGYIVETAENGIEGVKKAKILKPDLIILDVMMPYMNGIEACEQIRSIESLSNALIVFLSARTDEVTQLNGFEKGANDYVTKPVKPKVLMKKIEALLQLNAKEEIDERFAVIDNQIVWHGGMNLLGKEDVWDNLMRIKNVDVAAELLEISLGKKEA